LGNLIKVIELLYKILELAKGFDASFEKTAEGKIKICIIIDPKIILTNSITENNEK
jgi:hypothetical protein